MLLLLLLSCNASEIPIHDKTIQPRAHRGPQTRRDEYQTQVQIIHPVDVVELRWHARRHEAIPREQNPVTEEDQARGQLEEKPQRGDWVRDPEPVAAAAPSLRREGTPRGVELVVIARVATDSPCFPVAVVEVGAVPGRGRDGAVPDDVAARLRVEEEHRHEDGGGEDGQEPEYRAPAEVFAEEAAEDGAEGGPHDGAEGCEAHVSAALRGGHQIGRHRAREGYGAAAAGALDGAQDEEGRVGVLEGESDVGADVDGKADDVDRSSPCGIR